MLTVLHPQKSVGLVLDPEQRLRKNVRSVGGDFPLLEKVYQYTHDKGG